MIGLFLFDAEQAKFLPVLPWWGIFGAGFMVSMMLEYPTSWLLEKLFHARWWDYSSVPLNLNGRTSVPTSIAFGAAAILAMDVVLPALNHLLIKIPQTYIQLSALVMIAVLSADVTLTISALTDFQKRVNDIDTAFQNHMMDAVAQMVTIQSDIRNKAAQRITVFKISEQKMHITRHLLANTLHEMIKEVSEQRSIPRRIYKKTKK